MTKGDDAMRGMRFRPFLLAVAAAVCAACGSDTPLQSGNDPALEPFVGDWEATEVILVNDANPSDSIDVLGEGGTFTINVQPSGTYTATLAYPSLPPGVEIGKLSVFGATVILQPTTPSGPSVSSTFAFDGPDKLTLDGPIDFDFNGDATPEPGQAHFELERQ
jgi:hypothetical protein